MALSDARTNAHALTRGLLPHPGPPIFSKVNTLPANNGRRILASHIPPKTPNVRHAGSALNTPPRAAPPIAPRSLDYRVFLRATSRRSADPDPSGVHRLLPSGTVAPGGPLHIKPSTQTAIQCLGSVIIHLFTYAPNDSMRASTPAPRKHPEHEPDIGSGHDSHLCQPPSRLCP